MRRDERPYDPTEGAKEIEAIETQWTRMWESEGWLGSPDTIRKRIELKIIRPYIQKLPPGSRLLDGGCGQGDWVVYFTRQGYPTVGLDISRITIAKLAEKFPEIEFEVRDIRDTGYPSGLFDAYFSWGTFEHFEEGFDRVVAEAYRILKPGGILFVSVPFDNLRQALTGTLSKAWRNRQHTAAPTRFYQWRLTRDEIATILVRHGFDMEDVTIIHKRAGIRYWLHESFGLGFRGKLARGLAFCLAPITPGVLIGHMIMGIARRPA